MAITQGFGGMPTSVTARDDRVSCGSQQRTRKGLAVGVPRRHPPHNSPSCATQLGELWLEQSGQGAGGKQWDSGSGGVLAPLLAFLAVVMNERKKVYAQGRGLRKAPLLTFLAFLMTSHSSRRELGSRPVVGCTPEGSRPTSGAHRNPASVGRAA